MADGGPAKTCSEWISYGLMDSYAVEVKPDSSLASFTVFCDVEAEDGIGVATLRGFNFVLYRVLINFVWHHLIIDPL